MSGTDAADPIASAPLRATLPGFVERNPCRLTVSAASASVTLIILRVADPSGIPVGHGRKRPWCLSQFQLSFSTRPRWGAGRDPFERRVSARSSGKVALGSAASRNSISDPSNVATGAVWLVFMSQKLCGA